LFQFMYVRLFNKVSFQFSFFILIEPHDSSSFVLQSSFQLSVWTVNHGQSYPYFWVSFSLFLFLQ
jgi:hypothetical protein